MIFPIALATLCLQNGTSTTQLFPELSWSPMVDRECLDGCNQTTRYKSLKKCSFFCNCNINYYYY